MKWIKVYNQGKTALINLERVSTVEIVKGKELDANLCFYSDNLLYKMELNSLQAAEGLLEKVKNFIEDKEITVLHLY